MVAEKVADSQSTPSLTARANTTQTNAPKLPQLPTPITKKVWGVTPEESARIVHAFFESPHFTRGIPVVPGARGALARLSRFCDLSVVTSRQHAIQDATLEWLDSHYGGLFQEVCFGNHFALEGKSRSKSEICASIGARVLIDDNVGYARECAAAGVQVLLFDWQGSYPWSKLPAGEAAASEAAARGGGGITVVRDWREAEAALAALAATAAAPVGARSAAAAAAAA